MINNPMTNKINNWEAMLSADQLVTPKANAIMNMNVAIAYPILFEFKTPYHKYLQEVLVGIFVPR